MQSKELEPCVCGAMPEFHSIHMSDFLECPSCGIKGDSFFDGADEWLIKSWNAGVREGELNAE